jgi:integrase
VFEHIMPKRPSGVDRRHPMLPWQDAPAAFAKMRETHSMSARCLEFIALTAARLTEARAARLGEIDFDAATWTIPSDRMKMRRITSEPHVVPLSRQAVALVRELHQVRGNTALVFAGRTPRKPITPGAVWQFSERVTEGKASPHGWRSTFRTWCADNGVEREVAESALAHSLGGVEAAYNRAAMVERRRPVMAAWADFLDGASAANVLPLKRA